MAVDKRVRIEAALDDLRAKASVAGESSDWVRVCDVARAAMAHEWTDRIDGDGHYSPRMVAALDALGADNA